MRTQFVRQELRCGVKPKNKPVDGKLAGWWGRCQLSVPKRPGAAYMGSVKRDACASLHADGIAHAREAIVQPSVREEVGRIRSGLCRSKSAISALVSVRAGLGGGGGALPFLVLILLQS